MKIHRFYVGKINTKMGLLELDNNIWIHDERLLQQWLYVLRFRVGDQLVLFNEQTERLYEISKIEAPHSVNLSLLTEQKRILPKVHVYLLWALLKKDNNELIIQKATELGVRNFVPIIAERSQKTDLNLERAKKIIIEATEQCGRADIAEIREPILLGEALAEYQSLPLYVCDRGESTTNIDQLEKMGLLIGPEGGWSEAEKALFKKLNLPVLNIASFTLRAETAAIIAVSKLLQ